MRSSKKYDIFMRLERVRKSFCLQQGFIMKNIPIEDDGVKELLITVVVIVEMGTVNYKKTNRNKPVLN